MVIDVKWASDDIYIVSFSFDNTIRIWNLLKKRQETVFKENTSNLFSRVHKHK